MVRRIAGRAVVPDATRHRIRHAVRQVHAGIAKPDAGIRRGQQHVGARLIVARVVHRANDELRHHAECLQRPDVADRIRPLVGRTQRRPIGQRAPGERQRRERLDGVAQDVEAARRRHFRGHRAGVVWIQIAECGLEAAAGNAGLRMHPAQVEDADTGRLTARPRRRGNRHQRLQRTWHRQSLADRRVHVVEEVGRRIHRVEIDGLRRVDGRTATDSDDGVEGMVAGEGNGVEKRFVAWLDAHAVVDDGGDAVGRERIERDAHRRQVAQGRVGDHERALDAQFGEVRAHFARNAGAEADGRRRHLESKVIDHRRNGRRLSWS